MRPSHQPDEDEDASLVAVSCFLLLLPEQTCVLRGQRSGGRGKEPRMLILRLSCFRVSVGRLPGDLLTLSRFVSLVSAGAAGIRPNKHLFQMCV